MRLPRGAQHDQPIQRVIPEILIILQPIKRLQQLGTKPLRALPQRLLKLLYQVPESNRILALLE
jgi:hypothetical protein